MNKNQLIVLNKIRDLHSKGQTNDAIELLLKEHMNTTSKDYKISLDKLYDLIYLGMLFS